MIYSRIAGTGSYLPEKILTNSDLEKMVDTTDEWIRTRTGIERRHIAADGETTVDLAEHAARRAIEAAGVDARATSTSSPSAPPRPIWCFPTAARCCSSGSAAAAAPAFSVETACAASCMRSRSRTSSCAAARRSARWSSGAETLSRITDWTDRATACCSPTAPARWCWSRRQSPGILSTHLHADGAYKDLLYCASGGSKGFPAREARDPSCMAGSEVFKVAVNQARARGR